MRLRSFIPLFGFIISALEANPQIKIKSGDCNVVGKATEEACAKAAASAETTAYAEFVKKNFDLIKQMYTSGKAGTCANLATNVRYSCEDSCSNEECLWLLAVTENQGGARSLASVPVLPELAPSPPGFSSATRSKDEELKDSDAEAFT